jgi:hypothetical protein
LERAFGALGTASGLLLEKVLERALGVVLARALGVALVEVPSGLALAAA